MTLSSKQLSEEGLTKDFLKTINLSEGHSPVQLMPNEDPVILIMCGGGFWVKLSDGTYLKDEKNKLFIVSEKQAIIGRARYLLNFQAQILQDKIDNLVRKTKLSLEMEAKTKISQMKEILKYAGHLKLEGIETALFSMQKEQAEASLENKNYHHIFEQMDNPNPNQILQEMEQKHQLNRHERKVNEAKEIATEPFIQAYNSLVEMLNNEDYDSLFVMLKQEGMPLLFAANKSNEKELATLSDFFHASNVSATIAEVQEKGHLYCYCKFKVLSEN